MSSEDDERVTPYSEFDDDGEDGGRLRDRLARVRERFLQRRESDVDRRSFLRNAGALGGLGIAGLGRDGDGEATDAGTLVADATATGAEAVTEEVRKPTAVRTFPVYDADGDRTGDKRWRTVRKTGNCCENYLATAPDGAVYDMGGNFLLESTDRGESWTRVKPPTPYPQTSEGNVMAAPNGDIVAIDWNPYSGDRLIAYKYEAEEGRWLYNETATRVPFYDRPWMSVIPGPFEIAGQSFPYIVVQRGGTGGGEKNLFVSFDGLNYVALSSRTLDTIVAGSTTRRLSELDDANGFLDWVQPQTETGVTPLGDGRALGTGPLFSASDCARTLLEGNAASDLQWSCFDTPNGLPDGRLLADSRGILHNVEFVEPARFAYRYSRDGGQTWTEDEYDLPGNYRIADGAISLYDFKAHGATDVSAVSIHATDPDAEVDQDMVFKFTGAVDGDREVEVMYLGNADASYVSGVNTAERFDFQTLSVFPDGRLVVSFADLEDRDPQIAIEVPDSVGESPAFEAFGTRETGGSAFTAGQLNEFDLAVQASKPVQLRDTIPAAWTVPEENPDVEKVSTLPNEGIKHVHLKPTEPSEGIRRTYTVKAPEDPADSGRYDFGPLEVQVRGEGDWVDVDGTAQQSVAVGVDTDPTND